MAKSSQFSIIGIILIVIGAALALWGYQLSGSIGSQITRALTGSEREMVVNVYLGAVGCVALGIYSIVKG